MPVPMYVEDAGMMQPLATSRKRKVSHGDWMKKASVDAARLPSVSGDSATTTCPSPRSPKRLCLKATPRLHHWSKSNPTQSPPTAGSPAPIASLLLRPCHVCWRRPTTRVVLDCYADCEVCGSRTCYICFRQCEDDGCQFATVDIRDGHAGPGLEVDARQIRKRRVCSLCAVEYIDMHGVDMVRCVDCADVVNKRHRIDFLDAAQPP